ncbi:uncharacterized protein LOC115755147 isoform X3 [Rhodamnia argentea]|uniref:Uncharacterized protein LOC115755147 isoform X3 n=1 Tax=Rhodamnia argentea TaxID=178133 RepID=A0ABM3HF84_9MYRT|nr:uncharacterized protein LOC115755147 isoform X3 [Rhodamnia argentea]
MELGERLKFKMLITRFLRVFWVDSSSKTFRKNKERLLAQRRTEQSKLRVKHSELVFRGPAPPKPLTTPEVASEFDSEHPFFKVVTQQDHESKVVGSNRLHEELAILSWIFMVLHFQGLSHLP